MSRVNHQCEADALLLCAHVQLTVGQLEQLGALVNAAFDWDYFYRLVRRHSLVPLVYKQIDATIKDAVPQQTYERFRKGYQENAARNLVLAGELTSLTEALAQSGIEAISFKGPALAVAAYDDLSLRRFVDLDLIVRRADMPRAIDVLLQHGYEAAKSLDNEQQALLLRTQHNLQFVRGRFIVELHWQVASELFASSVTAEELWANSQTVEVGGRTLKTLGQEDLLFALSVHGSRHLWQRLAWICDIDRLIRRSAAIDWPALLLRARKAKASRMFLLGIALAADLFGTELPADVSRAITADPRITALAADAPQRLFDGPEQQALGFGTTLRFNLQVRPDWPSRLKYIRFLLAPTDSDLEIARLSPSLHFAYYLIRPLRLIRSGPARDPDAENKLAN
jgi:hypothetical protein